MAKKLLALGIICLVTSAASAATLAQEYQAWLVGKDNIVYTKSGQFKTSGGSRHTSSRWVRTSFDGVWYGDWTNADKDAIAALMAQDAATVTGVPAATGWELHLDWTGAADAPGVKARSFVWKARTGLPEMIEVEVEPGVFEWQVDPTYPFGNDTWAEYGWPDNSTNGSCNDSPNYDGSLSWPKWQLLDGTPADCLLDMADFGGLLYTPVFTWDGSGVTESATSHLNANELPDYTMGNMSIPLDATSVSWVLDTTPDNYVQGIMMNESGSTLGGTMKEGDSPATPGPRLVLYYLVTALDGDADGDGNVDLDDMIIVAQNWGTGTTWAEGDFDADGDVDKDDLELLARNWTGVTALPAGLVPEPATIALLGLGALGVFARRRRQ